MFAVNSGMFLQSFGMLKKFLQATNSEKRLEKYTMRLLLLNF